MYKLIQYLKHRITATNQHGVHSPFVYGYVTKCLYQKTSLSIGKTGFKASKSLKVLLQSMAYFSVKRIKIASESLEIKNRIRQEFDVQLDENSPFDLVYTANPMEDLISIHPKELHNDSLVFVDNIHRTKKNSILWEALKEDDTVRVSIDLFHCGILFFRKEQAKEHFKIRI